MASTAREAVDAHMKAINALNSDAMINSQHFPFVHLWPDGRADFVENSGDFLPLNKDSDLGTEWHHTVLESAEEITQGREAVSFRIAFSRRRADDSVLGQYEAVWIATKNGKDWGIQFRHGALEL
jgi:hypothetical protein